MDRRILFISSEAQGFLINIMINSLKSEGYEVIISPPDIVHIDLIPNLPHIFIVYLEGDLVSFDGTLNYLKKLVSDGGNYLYLIGTDVEITNAYTVIPKPCVQATFSRPVNMKDITAKLNPLFGENLPDKRRILVVDDDSVMLRTMNNWLSKQYDVFMANSGMNAISLLAKQHVDLILLDYEMPVISGLQVFEMLQSEPATANIPVIFLTAKDDKDTVMKVLSVKPAKYLLKTMPTEELMKSIDNFFKGK